MAGNYVIVANFCDWPGPFLKFEKIAVSVGFRHKNGGFRLRFKNRHSNYVTATIMRSPLSVL